MNQKNSEIGGVFRYIFTTSGAIAKRRAPPDSAHQKMPIYPSHRILIMVLRWQVSALKKQRKWVKLEPILVIAPQPVEIWQIGGYDSAHRISVITTWNNVLIVDGGPSSTG